MQMKNYVLRQAALLVAAVLLTTSFWSCSKEEPVPEPTPPVVSVTGVTLNKTSTSIQVGGTETLTATVLPEDATNQNVTWKSDKPEIASVDANGKVTGVKAGEATITVTTEDGGKTATCKVTVSETSVAVTGVKLNKSETSLLVGGNETLTATVLPEDATNQNVTWESDKPEIASVDDNGKVTGVAAGEATITVTTEDGGKTATCKVTVSATSVAVTGVTLNKTELTLAAGGSETLTATVAPADATNKKVTWKSSDAAVASVDANGKVTGVKAGEATITVTTEDGGKTATCKVTVKTATIAVTGVTLNKTALTLNIGASETLTATVAPADATNKKVTWKSSDAAVASVDANGKVTGVKAGEATITVTTEDGAKTATCKVTVTIPVTGVTLNKTSTTIAVGVIEELTATITPANATNQKVTWKSSDLAVARVKSNGTVLGVSVGEATITVTTEDGGKTATCKVRVLSKVNKVTVTPANLTLGKNKRYTLTATVDTQSGPNTGVTWTSSNPLIAMVSSSTGEVITRDKVGTVTITATSIADPTKKGTCTITVSADQAGIEFGEYGQEENW